MLLPRRNPEPAPGQYINTPDQSPRELDVNALRRWPLTAVSGQSDKEDRGQVLVIAGSREIPGAAILAATAALRAGAGKLTIATVESVAPYLGLLVPEARVIGLPETQTGGLDAKGVDRLTELADCSSAVLIGPGLTDSSGSASFFRAAVEMFSQTPMVLDALAMDAIIQTSACPMAVVLTPHAGEMAHLTGLSKQQVKDRPFSTARAFALRCKANKTIIALKGAVTMIVPCEGVGWRHSCNIPGLGTSGSGDVLAGIITGLIARGAELEQAAAWGVAVHALAGQALAEKVGPLGFLARDLAAEIPAILRECAV